MKKKQKENQIKISVRSLVEFIFRSGDINQGNGVGQNAQAMAEGGRIHRKIQKSMGSGYQAEVPLQIIIPIEEGEWKAEVCLEGRADGIIRKSGDVVVDEIKGMYFDIAYLDNPVYVHQAQAMCYAYILLEQEKLEKIGIRLTYCNMETEELKYFEQLYRKEELEKWFTSLMDKYVKWAKWKLRWDDARNESIRNLQFPFPYREGQKKLVSDVYRTIIREKKLFIEAPTGVGKTISTVFPAVKAMGEKECGRIFYLTAKTITRTVAEHAFLILKEQGLQFKAVTITAKEKSCILEKVQCDPKICPRAKGHYDRINDALFELLSRENEINRELINSYADKHCVCPFEMNLDIALWADAVICDYNYAFDPNACLKRFFQNEKNDYVYLIDEAHNLVERARKMYSAELLKESFLDIKKIFQTKNKKLYKILDICNKDMLALKRQCDSLLLVESIADFAMHLVRAISAFEDFYHEHRDFHSEQAVQLYFDIKHFINMYETAQEDYIIYADYSKKGEFCLHLTCMDPSKILSGYLKKGKSAIFFSATLLPVNYYKEQLGGTPEDYAVYVPSPFQKENRLLLIGADVNTRYSRRTEKEYDKILDYIEAVCGAKTGNYLVFFSSYQMMNDVLGLAFEQKRGWKEKVFCQKSSMSEQEKEEFLVQFLEDPKETRIGFGVMGGIFSEGIDLKKDRLIGVIIVGTGLPMVCNERELYRDYYQQKKSQGFEYAYLYQGMNKVLQSAGRVIRTGEDKGVIVLLDERFLRQEYRMLFPREWFPNQIVNRKNVEEQLNQFWMNKEGQNV